MSKRVASVELPPPPSPSPTNSLLGDHHDQQTHTYMQQANSHHGVLSILSSAKDDFKDKFEIVREIGRGGFSTVYQCRDKVTGTDYAVKIIDLRPLRLRERFNPTRLRREVDIMRRLNHPNIIKFVDVYETTDHLLMLMEYCPGEELFDVILARKFFSEKDAKPIFAQIARALFYLHSLNIIHRDIKPENVLILNSPDPITGLPIAKLLDFGLSKNAGAGGSAAKTFVGTPCYLSPEVEYTSKGLGGTYGLPADCWSLGAVLYVMLVARFPEFEQDNTGKVVLRLPPVLWDDVSSEAKDLIRGLMNTNPAARLTAGNALLHPWLGEFRSTAQELTSLALSCYDLGQGLQEEEERAARAEGRNDMDIDELTPGGIAVHRHAMVLRNTTAHGLTTEAALQLAPLLNLQRSVASCFEEANLALKDIPDVAAQVRRGAILCRSQLHESTQMLRKVEQTATAVLNMFPDLELAIEENEPQLAQDFFTMVKGWVVELRELVSKTQDINKASMQQIQCIVESTAVTMQTRNTANAMLNGSLKANYIASRIKQRLAISNSGDPNNNNNNNNNNSSNDNNSNNNSNNDNNNNNGSSSPSSANSVAMAGPPGSTPPEVFTMDEVIELFMNLFSPGTSMSPAVSSNNLLLPGLLNPRSGGGSTTTLTSTNNDDDHEAIDMDHDADDSYDEIDVGGPHTPRANGTTSSTTTTNTQSTSSAPPLASTHLTEALMKLHRVDIILDQLNNFWGNTEVVLDVLTKKGQHVEQFIHFSSKPRLLERFKERMEEYKRFWEKISIMCSQYVTGVGQGTSLATNTNGLYTFLDE